MVPANILRRTFQARHNGGTGTVFTLDVQGRQYLITARHVVETLAPHGTLDIYRNGSWTPTEIGDVWFASSGADLAVIDLLSPLSPSLPVTAADTTAYSLSQEVYFLGFPFGLRTEVGSINDGYPIPFVKAGIISSFEKNSGNSSIIFIDGINNPGFSGGPVVTVDARHQVTVIGIIAGYRFSDDPILLHGKPSGLTYQSNTGLIVASNLKEVFSRIAASPTGAQV